MKYYWFTLLVFFIGLSAFTLVHNTREFTTLSELEIALGADVRDPVKSVDDELVALGYTLITEGKANYKTNKGKRISSYFVCTDCHNIKREFPNLTSQDPQERLEYTTKSNMPFLPASSFYGIYNRKKYYTKDYVKKYGDLVVNARDTLENAIQLCAKYCSSGRYLEDWELKGVMHYFKSTELRVDSLDLTVKTKNRLKHLGHSPKQLKKAVLMEVEKSYTPSYTATFSKAKLLEDRRFGEGGDVENGKLIYNNSCLFCHDNARVTNLDLDNNKLDAQMFWKNIKNYSDLSLYQIIRYGTYPKQGRKQYMPLYTKEKMSDQQLEDLVAYIKQLAEKN